MILLLITFAVFSATIIGGLFALYLRDKLHLILGFSAGAIIAVAFFDILPEALNLTSATYTPFQVLTFTTVGFALYLMLDRFFLLHHHTNEKEEENDMHIKRGVVGAASLSFHSFLDGVGIGLAFHVSPTVGIIVAVAVLGHDFSDGINTVNMIIKNNGKRMDAFKWLLIDAIAPVLGIMVTLFFTVSDHTLGLLLALFSGFFLYIGASDLIPESYHSHPKHWTTISTVLGICALYLIIRLASI